MNEVRKTVEVKVAVDEAFHKFVDELNTWWPKEYTWSQDKLQEIFIDGRQNGLCTEIGPHGFRCDWGRVIEIEKNKKITLQWQISPKREPVPDPDHASDISIEFTAHDRNTILVFKHQHFHKHGEGAKEYAHIMDSEMGWSYILGEYKSYCEEQSH